MLNQTRREHDVFLSWHDLLKSKIDLEQMWTAAVINLLVIDNNDASHVAGCEHEFCSQCALYLCATNCTATMVQGPPGSIACPLCRNGIVSFTKLSGVGLVVKEISRSSSSLSLSFCTCSSEVIEQASLTTPFYTPEFRCTRMSPLRSSFRSLSFQRFPSMKMTAGLCMGAPNIGHSLFPCSVDRSRQNRTARCSRSSLRRSSSEGRRSSSSWFSALNQYVTAARGCWFFSYFGFNFLYNIFY